MRILPRMMAACTNHVVGHPDVLRRVVSAAAQITGCDLAASFKSKGRFPGISQTFGMLFGLALCTGGASRQTDDKSSLAMNLYYLPL